MRVVEFGSLFHFIRNGMSVKQDKSGDGLPITRIETIAGATIDSDRVGYAGVTEEDGARWLLEPGDILFSHINSVEHVGKCAIYKGVPEKLVHGMNLLCMRCDQTQLLPEFATYLIRSPGFRDRLQNFINKAVNQASVSIGNLRPIPVKIPSLPEQRRIAAILDQADVLRAKRREALVQLDILTQSIFIEMFGDPNFNNKNWQVVSLNSICHDISDINHKMPKAVEQGMPFISAKDLVENGKIDFEDVKQISLKDFNELSRKSRPRKGDIIYSRIGANLGKARMVVVDFDFLASYSCCTIRPNHDKVDGVYLCSLLDSPFILQQAQRGVRAIAVPDLGMGEIKGFKIILPPLQLQREFSRRISEVERIRSVVSVSLVAMNSLFSSLQDRAFAGEL